MLSTVGISENVYVYFYVCLDGCMYIYIPYINMAYVKYIYMFLTDNLCVLYVVVSTAVDLFNTLLLFYKLYKISLLL